MRKIMTIDGVVAALGGRARTARLAGVVPTAVSNWKKAGRIARNTYPLMIAALNAAGATAPPSLWGMKHLRQRVRAAARHRSARRS